MAWVMGRRRNSAFAEAALLPFAEDADLVTTPKGVRHE
jgi:hypothetical protein